MTYEKLLVRVLGSCETMANANVVCTDKTGTLTQNEMTVVAGSIGVHGKFVRQLAENELRTNANEESGVNGSSERRHAADFSIEQADLNSILSPALRDTFNEAITVNSTAFEDVDPESGAKIFVGSKTETALLKFAQELKWADWKATREAAKVLQMVPFSSERKAMGVVVRRANGSARLYLKGASEILTKRCSRHVVVHQGEARDGEVETTEIDQLAADNISRTIIFYANQTLRTIALCYRDYESWPPAGLAKSADNENEVRCLLRDCTTHSDRARLSGRLRGNGSRHDAHCYHRYRGSAPPWCPRRRREVPPCGRYGQNVHG
jgi:Ca2+-transporting ATPase